MIIKVFTIQQENAYNFKIPVNERNGLTNYCLCNTVLGHCGCPHYIWAFHNDPQYIKVVESQQKFHIMLWCLYCKVCRGKVQRPRGQVKRALIPHVKPCVFLIILHCLCWVGNLMDVKLNRLVLCPKIQLPLLF